MNALYPPFSTIGIVAPAGKLRPEPFDTGTAFLRAAGKELKFGAHINGPSPVSYLSADAENRTADLTRLWLDPEIDLLLAVRGGFGSAHLLPLLDWEALKNRPELPLAGYSDITALHWAMEKFGAGRPVAGPMLGKLAECVASPYSVEYHLRAFRPEPYEIEAAPEYGPIAELQSGSATGLPLVGNLTVAASLCGTPYFPNVSGRILILEDLNEPIYKLDRNLTMLEQNGVLSRCAAVVFGQFSDCAAPEDLSRLFRHFASKINGPVLMNFPFGHTFPIVTLDFHRPISISSGHISVLS